MPERSDLIIGIDLTPHHRKELTFNVNNGILTLNKILDVNKKEYYIVKFTKGIKKYGTNFLLSKLQLSGFLKDTVEIFDLNDKPLELSQEIKNNILKIIS